MALSLGLCLWGKERVFKRSEGSDDGSETRERGDGQPDGDLMMSCGVL